MTDVPGIAPSTPPGPSVPTAPSAPPAPPPSTARRRGRFARIGRGLFEWAKSLSLAIILFIVVRSFFVEAFKIPSGSMESTLLVGDFLLVNKLVYGAEVPFTSRRLPAVHAPQFRDVIVFQWPRDLSKNLVKRLVGLPGDTIAMRKGEFVRNGATQREAYATHSDPTWDPEADDFHWQREFLVMPPTPLSRYHPSRNNWGPIVVPPHHYFVLGDNRDNSEDSRYWGFVPDSMVRGKPLIVYYSYEPDTLTTMDWLTRIRWRRLGEAIH
jgi:signal peptidase I